MEISFHSHPETNWMIATIFTWHDSCAVMACAKICRDLMASNGITARRIFHRIWIAGKKWLVKRAPRPLCGQCISRHDTDPLEYPIPIAAPEARRGEFVFRWFVIEIKKNDASGYARSDSFVVIGCDKPLAKPKTLVVAYLLLPLIMDLHPTAKLTLWKHDMIHEKW